MTPPQNPLAEHLLPIALSSLREHGAEPDSLPAALAAADLPALTGWFTIRASRQSAADILDTGWRFARFEPVPVADLEDWAQYGERHRSWGFHLHAWEFMDPLLAEIDDPEVAEDRLRQAVDIALGWVRVHRGADSEADPMAWYDMSQSLRVPRLIALAMRAAREPSLRAETLILADALRWHLEELHRDHAFNPRNNHGFYTAVSQVHAARYLPMIPGAEATAREGEERLALMAIGQFAEDGVHREHSPDYHRMLLNSFEMAVRDELIADPEIRRRIERAAAVLGWMIQPDGTIVQFGDSPATEIVGSDARSLDPGTQFLLTDGSEGETPVEELAVLKAGGYAFVRSPQPRRPGDLRRSGYLAFAAGFHSRAHKHADDLNLVWYDRGRQILVDAGRYGYGALLAQDDPLRTEGFYYADPRRQYVESSTAHNVLVLDGKDHRRHGRRPYGSALTDCERTATAFDLSGRVRHEDFVHRRRVVYRPGHELRLLDAVHSRREEEREGTIWLNVDGSFELESATDGRVVLVAEDTAGPLRLEITGPDTIVDPVRGQEEPLRGWRSRRDGIFEPTWSIGFRFPVMTRASVETRLRLT